MNKKYYVVSIVEYFFNSLHDIYNLVKIYTNI